MAVGMIFSFPRGLVFSVRSMRSPADLILIQYHSCFESQRRWIFQWTKFNFIFRYEEQQMDRYQMTDLTLTIDSYQ